MTPVFADTSFYIAFTNPKDAWYEAATMIGNQCRGAMVTTEYVLVELGNYLCRPADRELFLRIVEMLHGDSKTDLLPTSSSLLEAGLALFAERPDKGWSLTDCISFAVMEQYGIKEALSCDHHFEQAGFRLLLER